MKTRIVLWGNNEKDEKLLIALSLNAKENKVDMYTIPAAAATEAFYNLMNNQWRNGQDLEFPEGHTHEERPLSMTDGLLPENIRVDRTDVVSRAQTEWHFVVLSAKLYEAYHSEMDDLKERINQAKTFEKEIWEELKNFWSKVQGQINEKNLFREHGQRLREFSNELFADMKKLRKSMDDEYKTRSKEFVQAYNSKLEAIEKKVTEGLSLQPLFNELKKIQQEYRNTPFTKDDRQKIWNRIDKAFKTIKEKKYGPSKGGSEGKSNALSRIERRYEGLLRAIEKMEKSIQRDRNDLNFQDRRIAQSDGQLEAQIRQAKVKMIEERIRSKEEKLADMVKTKAELEGRVEKEKAREVKRAEEAKKKEAAAKVKEKIADEMKTAASALEVSAEKLEKAAEEIVKSKDAKKKDKVTEAFEAEPAIKKEAVELSEEIEAIVDAVTEPTDALNNDENVGEAEAESNNTEEPDTAEDKNDAAGEESFTEKAEEFAEKAEDVISGIATTIGEAFQDVGDTIKAVASVVGDKIEEAIEDFTDEEE